MQMLALLVTADEWLISLVDKATQEFGIETQTTHDAVAASDHVRRAKYDGVVLDFDTVSETPNLLEMLRNSRSNRSAVVFAVATEKELKRNASRCGANFLLDRPIDVVQVRRGLSASHGLMLRERRRYFRCAVQVPASLCRDGAPAVEGQTINVSNGGLGITTSIALKAGERLRVSFKLPNGVEVRAIGSVIWEDGHGKSGISFQSINSEMQSKLESWLDSEFASVGRIPTRAPSRQK
jgi:ActR/RegA family two-component response regulator